MSKNRLLMFVILIAAVALCLRLWRLDSVPPSLHWDEPSWGYNAYSILKTGKDEYGNVMPLIFKAFGDYKSAAYVYLTVIPVFIFGLNEFAVRFPAALFGGLNIIIFYFFLQEIFKQDDRKNFISLAGSLIIAFSPWNFHYSRGAWEVNVLLCVILLSFIFFFRSNREKPHFFYLSAVLLGSSLYVYASSKMLIPLIIIGLLILYKDKVREFSKEHLIKAVTLFILIIFPVIIFTFFQGAGGRLKVMSLFSYPRSAKDTNQILSQDGLTNKGFIYQFYHSDGLDYSRQVLERYFNHFSAKFLFFEGDWTNPRHSVPYAGVLNHFDIILLPVGIYYLVSRKVKNRNLVLFLLLIAPLPSAFSRDLVNATRSYLMLIPLSIISALGTTFLWTKVVKLKFPSLRTFLAFIFILGYLFSYVYYLDQFFVHAPIKNSAGWLYGYKQAVTFLNQNIRNYSQVVFTQTYGQPYIYYLFYSKYDPAKYQLQAKLIENPSGDVGYVEKIDNIEFRDIYWPDDRNLSKTLFIGNGENLPKSDIDQTQGAKILKEIYFLDGTLAFRIVGKI